MNKDMGASASQTGPAPSGLSRDASQAKPLVPSAGAYVIWRDWDINVREIAQVTPKLLRLKRGGYPGQLRIDDKRIIAFLPDRETAMRLKDSIGGVDGEFHRRRAVADQDRNQRVQAAEEARDNAIARLLASAMSAGTAETPQEAQGEARQRDPKGGAQTPGEPS